jgi:hypothetical protein
MSPEAAICIGECLKQKASPIRGAHVSMRSRGRFTIANSRLKPSRGQNPPHHRSGNTRRNNALPAESALESES